MKILTLGHTSKQTKPVVSSLVNPHMHFHITEWEACCECQIIPTFHQCRAAGINQNTYQLSWQTLKAFLTARRHQGHQHEKPYVWRMAVGSGNSTDVPSKASTRRSKAWLSKPQLSVEIWMKNIKLPAPQWTGRGSSHRCVDPCLQGIHSCRNACNEATYIFIEHWCTYPWIWTTYMSKARMV